MIVTALCALHYFSLRSMTFDPRVSSAEDRGSKHDLRNDASESEPAGSQSILRTMGAFVSTSGNQEADEELQSLSADVYDIIKDIRDPEKPNTLEELKVVSEEGIRMSRLVEVEDAYTVHIAFTPTVPHCSLATLIGLCIRVKLERSLPYKHKVDILIAEGTHSTEGSINKQINDKERIAAAMENPNLRELVEKCIKEDDY